MVTDFGLSRAKAMASTMAGTTKQAMTSCGTLFWMTLEVIKGHPYNEKVDVYAFGLLTTFQGVMFPGSARLMELADNRTEIQVEARCWCGAWATHNARFVDGVQVISGATVVVGDTSSPAAGEVFYDLLCRAHWMEGARAARGDQLELLDDDVARPVAVPLPRARAGRCRL